MNRICGVEFASDGPSPKPRRPRDSEFVAKLRTSRGADRNESHVLRAIGIAGVRRCAIVQWCDVDQFIGQRRERIQFADRGPPADDISRAAVVRSM